MKLNFSESDLNTALNHAKKEFDQYNKTSGNHLLFNQEAAFMYNKVASSSTWAHSNYTLTSLQSIIDSFLCIAKTGLTLDPSQQLCYLKCIFDPIDSRYITEFEFTYRGYLKLISRSGMVKIITADVTYSKDHFIYNGTRALVEHKVTCLSISQRGNFAGGYCTSELIDNAIITTVMSPEEIYCIEENAKQYDNSAWNSPFIDELRRKTLIRRHWKTLSTIVQSLQPDPVLSVVNEIHQEIDANKVSQSSDQQLLQGRF